MKNSGQRDAPLYRAVKNVQKGNFISFHVPLHGRGKGAPHLLRAGLGPTMQWDFTEISPLDDLHRPTGAIRRAEQLAAQLFGAGKTYFLVNGATVGLLALFQALTRPGDKVLLTRLSHKAALHGTALSGAHPVYLPVENEPKTGLPLNVSPYTVERALREHPEARILLVTSPSYWGITADLHAIRELTGSRGVLLAVDEAHGTHLPFCGGKLPHAAGAGADIWIHSAHKSLGALTPGAYLHLAENSPVTGIPFRLQVLQTSSPPYPVMVSLDLARRQAALQGRRMYKKTQQWALHFRRALEQKGVSVFSPGRRADDTFFLDPCRVTILCRGGKGRLLGRLLSEKYRIMVEMEDDDFILMVVGPASLYFSYERLARVVARALGETGSLYFMDEQRKRHHMSFPFLHGSGCSNGLHNETRKNVSPFALPPGKALMAPSRSCLLEASAGEISGEMVVLSPPGIPVLSPGEFITFRAADFLLEKRQKGYVFHGAGDPGLNNIKVVTEVNNI